jgi:hypothetical protein
MTTSEFAMMSGLAFLLWASGFGLGLLVSTFRKYMEKL